ncbi:MAG TPA: ribose-phosphate pyrophosphokinase [Candidatus Dormibacteraeota bacterium]|nr:ribose-phosphate pyrophosphokinase [Candidatus Dormibacteraeota bacterium]
MSDSTLALFALRATREYGERVSKALAVPLGAHDEPEFEDGEHKARPLVNVRNQDVYVLHSLYAEPTASVNDKLCRMLFFIGALKDASAASVTAVVPYLCYARQDRKNQPRDPVTTRYVAALFAAVGTDRVVAMDVHNLAAFQNAFRCPTDHLEATKLFVDYFADVVGDGDVVVVSPDPGGVKRAVRFQHGLSRRLGRAVTAAFVEKHRLDDTVSGEALVGEVRGRTAVIYDDLISTGGTLARAAQACRAHGASRVYAAATHGLFAGKAPSLVREMPVERVVVTDTVPPFRLAPDILDPKVTVLDSAPFVADAIRRIHLGESLSALTEV